MKKTEQAQWGGSRKGSGRNRATIKKTSITVRLDELWAKKLLVICEYENMSKSKWVSKQIANWNYE